MHLLICGALFTLFVLEFLALSEHRLDYPAADDWRYYKPGFLMPSALSLAWLMEPFYDTVFVTGKLLDWLVFHLGRHDWHLLSAASFLVMFGGWMIATVALALQAGRGLPFATSCSLVAFILPLAGMPYWVAVSPSCAKSRPSVPARRGRGASGGLAYSLVREERSLYSRSP